MFANVRVGPKLIGGFVAVALLAVLTGTVGLTKLASVKRMSDVVTRQNMPHLVTLVTVSNTVRDIRRIQAGMLLAANRKDNALFAQYEHDVLQLRDSVLPAAREEFEAVALLPQVEAAWKVFARAADEYLVSALAVRTHLRNDALPEAERVFLGESRERYTAANRELDTVASLLAASGKAREQSITDTYGGARRVVGSSMVIAFALAILLGVLISRSLAIPLAEVSARAERLESVCITELERGLQAMVQGDLSVHCEASTKPLALARTDEIGQVAASVDAIITRAQAAIASYGRLQHIVAALIGETDKLTEAARIGALSTRGDATQFQGAYRQLTQGFNNTLDLVLDPVNDAAAVLQRVAERDLSARVTGEYQGDHARIKNALNTAVDNLAQAMHEIAEATEQVAAAADQIATGSQSLAQGASEQASTIEEVSSSLHEITSMAKTSAASAKEAETLAAAAKHGTDEGGEKMLELAEAMSKLKSASDQTAKIVKTIDEIAFQTNLLALNAAVEAARAGDAGKGFAVVADEVRALSIRAAAAAKQTAALIEESVNHTAQGVTMTKDVQSTFVDIAKRASRVREVMAEMAAASEQQTLGIDQVNTAVEQMNAVTQSTAASAEESASAAEELTSQATQVRGLVGQFTLTGGGSGARTFSAEFGRPVVRKPQAPASVRTPVRATGRLSRVTAPSFAISATEDDAVASEF
ncbi:MAG: methyl-accepting chemotaxis protein [Gemmatimonadota bacterium]|nr:methyl-accepting chemotaxis protein [Gemmatimonadota bacterium]